MPATGIRRRRQGNCRKLYMDSIRHLGHGMKNLMFHLFHLDSSAVQ